MDFKNCTLHNTPALSLQGLATWARVVDVYDGDTLTLILPFKNEFFKFTCRMKGIDTCEMKSKNKENKQNAVRARNRLVQLCGKQIDTETAYTRKQIQALLHEEVVLVWVQCHEFDKYGRLLADLFASETASDNFAKILISEKLGYQYEGDTKMTEEEQQTLMTAE